ncbi:hypothetical protein ACF06W_33095 [Streptomyces albus]|uniref:hypothetical protein n=1 Tax=Streptomyces albus TaxID=1888 RepID=UPI0036F926A6
MGEGTVSGEGFDAAHAGADGEFAEQAEGADQADREGHGDVGAAAQFAGEVADVDDAHGLAVLLAEQCDRSGGFGLGAGRVPVTDRRVVENVGVDGGFDGGELVGGEDGEVDEAEVQAAVLDQGALMTGVDAEGR